MLGGGSALGLAHIGVIKVLQEENITFDAVFGTSMGAIIGSLYTAGVPWQKMADIASEFRFFQLFRWRLSKTGIIHHRELVNFLKEHIPVTNFNELSVPLYVVAADITNGHEVVFSEGDLILKVASSCAIPGIFTPVEIDNTQFVDGGMVYNVPVDIANRYGYKKNLAVNVISYSYKGKALNVLDVITRSLNLLARKSESYDLKKATVLLKPYLDKYGPMDYKEARWIIMEGEEAARRNINKLRKLFA